MEDETHHFNSCKLGFSEDPHEAKNSIQFILHVFQTRHIGVTYCAITITICRPVRSNLR